MRKKETKYPVIENLQTSDIIEESQLELFFNNGVNERIEDGTIRILSLFSGCGGMDLGLEGGFVCHKKSATNPDWINTFLNQDWCLLKKNKFRTVFACDILKDAQETWTKYMSRFDVNPQIFHLTSIVDLVKMHKETGDIFPANIDIVTGGFPCQDFSVAGKRKGFNSSISHDGHKIEDDDPTEETRGMLYMWMKEVINIVQPKMFIAENVKGLVSLGDVKDIIQHDFSTAHGNDYIVLDPQILHAGNYGVPETRERVIFIGIKRSALNAQALEALAQNEVPDEYNPYPKPTHNYNVGIENLASPVTCLDVLKNLPEPENSKDLSQKNFSGAKYMGNIAVR